MKIIKEYQTLIGLLVIALAVYLGLTTTTKNDYVYPKKIDIPKPKAGDPTTISSSELRAMQRRYNAKCPDGQEFNMTKYRDDRRNKVQMDDIKKYCGEPKNADGRI
tara:strand:- start:236 stop:553 length:318 start_codon:yes stop_codon:yes gene_type:complete